MGHSLVRQKADKGRMGSKVMVDRNLDAAAGAGADQVLAQLGEVDAEPGSAIVLARAP